MTPTMPWPELAVLVLYTLGALLMHARLMPLDSVTLADLSFEEPPPRPPAAAVSPVIVALWPLAVVVVTLVTVAEVCRRSARPSPAPRVAPSGGPGRIGTQRGAVHPRPAISSAAAVMPRQEDPWSHP